MMKLILACSLVGCISTVTVHAFVVTPLQHQHHYHHYDRSAATSTSVLTVPLLMGTKPVSLLRAMAPTDEEEDQTSTKSNTLSLDSIKNFDFSNLLSNVKEIDLTGIENALEAGKDNLMQGEFGKRGEAYVAAQLALMLCIAIGGIPVIGGLVNLLLGPILLLAGLSVIVLCVNEMGAAMAPWPVPSEQNTELKTTGVFEYVRHPTYAGLLAACAGWSIVTDSAERLLLTAILLYALDLKSDFEEVELRKVFPNYDDYATQVPNKFFPKSLLNQLPWNKQE